MKRFLKTAVGFVLCFMLAFAYIPPVGADGGFYSTAELLEIKSNIEEDASMGTYATVQGACTDGSYAYFAVQNGGTVILKYDMHSWELSSSASVGGLGHANDMAYNSSRGYIVVANNYSSDDILTLVDPSSLTVIKTVVPKQKKTESEIKKEAKSKEIEVDEVDEYKRIKVYSIAYDASRRCYVAGISGTYDYALLDEDFTVTERFKGVSTGYTRQGCDCDGTYVYFPQSGGSNVIAVYDYSGNLIKTMSLGHTHEVENLFHVGKNFFLTLHYYGNYVHRAGLSDSTMITFTVDYEPSGGSGYMDSHKIHYGTDTALMRCSFEKPGYFFGGWRVKRDSDGKYRGYKLGSYKGEWLSSDKLYNYELIADEAKVSKTVKFGTAVMEAFWINERYVIDFDSDGGEGWMAPETVEYHDEYTLPLNAFVKHGYVFSGYLATRDADGRVYGLRKGADTPEWLEEEDVASPYLFKEGESVKELTYDGSVRMTAQFSYAFIFDGGGSALKSYIGVDEEVAVPDNGGRLSRIMTGAFDSRDTMTELYFPGSVNTLEKQSVVNCAALEGIYFTDRLPRVFNSEAVADSGSPAVYLVHNGTPLCLGFYADRHNAVLIKNNYSGFKRGYVEYLKGRNNSESEL